MNDCLISFGSNLGDSEQTISRALAQLERELQSRESRPIEFQSSPFFKTRPIGGPSQQSAFINGAARFRTGADPRQIVGVLLELEQRFGRERRTRWDARTLDLDLLLCGETVQIESGCQIPHPRMCFRQFVLQPACEVAPGMFHPICGVTLRTLLDCILNRPREILLVANATRLDSLSTLVQENGWAAAVTTHPLKGLESHLADQSPYKLIALVDDRPIDPCRQPMAEEPWIKVHGGPILVINNQTEAAIQIELSAAIDAMRAI